MKRKSYKTPVTSRHEEIKESATDTKQREAEKVAIKHTVDESARVTYLVCGAYTVCNVRVVGNKINGYRFTAIGDKMIEEMDKRGFKRESC